MIGLNLDAWDLWLRYRKEIRKPLKTLSQEFAAKKLASFGPDQMLVVEQSIENGWQGLFPLAKSRNPCDSAEWMKVRAALRDADLRKALSAETIRKVGLLGGFVYLGSLRSYDLEQKRKEFDAIADAEVTRESLPAITDKRRGLQSIGSLLK
jgi:hypothetical protein